MKREYEDLLDADMNMRLIACEAYINNDINEQELVETYFNGDAVEALKTLKELVIQK